MIMPVSEGTPTRGFTNPAPIPAPDCCSCCCACCGPPARLAGLAVVKMK